MQGKGLINARFYNDFTTTFTTISLTISNATTSICEYDMRIRIYDMRYANDTICEYDMKYAEYGT
jgi:hypothetical protein